MSPRSLTQNFFGKHAGGYAKSRSFSEGDDLKALVKGLKPKKSDVALDVATGTGFTALALAPRVHNVVGVDITTEMLDRARSLASERSIDNVKFEAADAEHLPYPDRSFDIVATRRATHHFHDVSRFLREAMRVLRPGGRLGIADMSPPEGSQRFTNRIERLRDSSHERAFTPGEWTSLLTRAGFQLASIRVLQEEVTFPRWLYPVQGGGNEEKEVRLAWRKSPESARRLLGARFAGQEIRGWTKSRVVAITTPKTP